MSVVRFTTNQDIEAFRPGEYVSITGSISTITRATYKDNKPSITFALSNGTGKTVMCVASINKVSKIADILQLGRVIRIDGAFCTTSEVANSDMNSFDWRIEDDTVVDVTPNLGNVPFRLIIEDRTAVYIELDTRERVCKWNFIRGEDIDDNTKTETSCQ